MKNGLKGVTDATVFCKSMKKGGTSPMIRSMKSYEVGGVTGLDMPSSDTGANWPPKWMKNIKRNMEYNKLRNRQKSKNNRCRGNVGCN
jgi:hypothetical protein